MRRLGGIICARRGVLRDLVVWLLVRGERRVGVEGVRGLRVVGWGEGRGEIVGGRGVRSSSSSSSEDDDDEGR